jgi:hypothetical protein
MTGESGDRDNPMTQNPLHKRQQRYFQLSSALAQLDNVHLRSLFDTSAAQPGWGINHRITIRRTPVFVKRIPVTNLEYEHMFSTKNFYDLPTFYQYGLGSVGLGVFRELVAHIKTTNWVLAGAIETFPLLYHYRIIPSTGVYPEVDMAYHARYVEYWGNNANVGRYMLDRANANYELILCLEHIPHTVGTWLLDHPRKIPMVMTDMQATITFLWNHGLIHFDTHFFNMLTDGTRAYLTDFGLALDKEFVLAPAEQQFYRQHTGYDYGVLIWSLGFQVYRMYRNLPDADKNRIAKEVGLHDGLGIEDQVPLLLTHMDELAASGLMKLDRNYVTLITKYQPIITLMHTFYTDMRHNPQKDNRFQEAALRQLLIEIGVIPPVSQR